MIKIFFFWFHYIQAGLYIFSVRLENTMHNSWINHMISNDVQHYQMVLSLTLNPLAIETLLTPTKIKYLKSFIKLKSHYLIPPLLICLCYIYKH